MTVNSGDTAFQKGYSFKSSELSCAHDYLLPALTQLVEQERQKRAVKTLPLFDLGCGNGSVANYLAQLGYQVTGVDPSEDGINMAKTAYPELNLQPGSTDENLAGRFGQFPVVYSLEVIEHVYSARKFAACTFNLLEPGGTAIVSTPYHGYFKNLAIALVNGFDEHFKAIWDHGHIKFWSMRTLSTLLSQAGFVNVRFVRVGRIPPLARSMIAVAEKPGQV
ncbi:MAG TPA: methyltransferase domain-containing protein [Phycisphaerae bacterium]|nr:methyltransferase domain-containing protein [Phycisphaerae bacterium]